MIDLLLVVVGIVLVLQGADKLTDGSVALARRFSISELVIGLTVVAFGTSLPEFVVSLMAALRGTPSMGVGNIVGSNLFNTLMIVGVTAIIAPITVRKSTVFKDIPFTILASLVLSALALDHLSGGGSSVDILDRGDGIALLCFFFIFMTYTFNIARQKKNPVPATLSGNATTSGNATSSASATSSATSSSPSELPGWKVALFIVGGLVGLVLGGEIFVRGASGIARSMGISEAVIGLTLVAGGTSLPELATSIIAARKGRSGMAIGNVIGSNLFNIFLILGACSVVSPMPIQGITLVDFATLLLSGVFFWIFSGTQRRIVRWEGLVLVLIYLSYLTWLIVNL